MAMKNKLTFYLLMSFVINGLFSMTGWAETRGLNDNKTLTEKEIVLMKEASNRKTRSIINPPCSVTLPELALTFAFHSLSDDAEIILYSVDSEILRIPISRYQQGSELQVSIGYLESGSYTLGITTTSGEHWYGCFEYVSSNIISL